MGETIRCTMVAVASLVLIFAFDSAETRAQSSGVGYDLPSTLGGSFSETVDAIQAKARAAIASPAGGVTDYRATPRSGGPTTEPTAVRDSSWLTESAAISRSSRPTTDPLQPSQTVSPPSSSGSMLVDQLRSGQQFGSSQRSGAIATVAATQEMQGREAQTMTLPPRSGNSAAAGPANGFGSLPAGMELPPRTGFGTLPQGSASGTTFGSEFGVGASAWPQSQPTTGTVFGPQTAQEANFDPSLYNTTNASGFGAPPLSASSSPASSSAQREILPPGNHSRSASTGAAFVGGSALGMPAANSNAATTSTETLPSDWTYDQVAELGRMFGYPPSDPRMGDKVFVNNLYARYREYLQMDAHRQTATKSIAGANGSTAGWPNLTTTAGTISPNTIGSSVGGLGSADPRLASRPGSLLGTAGLAGFDSSSALTERTDVDPRLSKKDIEGLPPGAWSYDSYGNPIDKERYVLDRFGQRVDEETQFELTIGKKRRQQEELAAKQAAERGSSWGANSSIAAPSPSDRGSSNGVISDRVSVARNPTGGLPARVGASDSAAIVDQPALAGDVDLQSPLGRVGTVDQAGIAGTVKVIGKSNPYVNIFLLCSLVANVFLFASLHRLWYHHRDLIASSRIATSGISVND